MGREGNSRKGERRRGGTWRRGRGRKKIDGQRAHWDTIEHRIHFTRQCHSHRHNRHKMHQINYRVRVVMLGHHSLHSRHQ